MKKSRRTPGRLRTAGVLLAWLIAACAGVVAWSDLGHRLEDSVEVPGSDSQRASQVLRQHFGEFGEGSFTVLFRAPAARWGSPAFVRSVRASLRRAARVSGGGASPLRSLSATVSYAELPTTLSVRAAQARAPAVERAIGSHPGARVKLTGFPVISAETSATIAEDLRRAELVALPITALVLLLYFGSLSAAAIPLLFGLATISVAMAVVWLETWLVSIPVYATNVVTLVGIALAIDYSMLYVARYREERRRGLPVALALPATSRTAGRALVISGAVVAAGLAPLVFVPIPFFAGLGFATVAIPVVSLLAATTMLPALLRTLAPLLEREPRRRRRRLTALSSRTLDGRLVDFVMRRAGPVAVCTALLMLMLALPAIDLEPTGGSAEFARRAQLEQPRGDRPASPPMAPFEVLIDSGRAGGAWQEESLDAERRLLRRLAGGPGIDTIQAPAEAGNRTQASRLRLLDPSARYARIRLTASYRSGSRSAEALVRQLRAEHLPRARLAAAGTWVGGPSAADHDFVAKVKESAPFIALTIIVVMYLLLAALLRSPVLPLKAIVTSAISVAAACGVLVLVYELGPAGLAGLGEGERIEAWVPVLLFAALIGISTDYEVFMVTRMREEWMRSHDNDLAVRTGLQRVGGVITVSALVMVTIFAGFTLSRVTALQQFGIGLIAGVVLDATVVRLFLVPASMKLVGRWNWSFPTPSSTRWADRALRWLSGR